MRNIAAWTPAGLMPPFVSINKTENKVSITVRSKWDGDHTPHAEAEMTHEEWQSFRQQIIERGEV